MVGDRKPPQERLYDVEQYRQADAAVEAARQQMSELADASCSKPDRWRRRPASMPTRAESARQEAEALRKQLREMRKKPPASPPRAAPDRARAAVQAALSGGERASLAKAARCAAAARTTRSTARCCSTSSPTSWRAPSSTRMRGGARSAAFCAWRCPPCWCRSCSRCWRLGILMIIRFIAGTSALVSAAASTT